VNNYSQHVVLDLFAGTGFGVALREMGVQEHAVDIMPEVAAVRARNGMGLAYEDVWDIHRAIGLWFETLIGGPPCPTFSTAGKGSGRAQMPLILEAILERSLWKNIDALRDWADALEDQRTGLVLVPLAYAWEFTPDYILLEQVPTVLPIWQAYEVVLQEMGYHTWSGILNAEQYGVPQTRKRAFLMARRQPLGPVAPPIPTHSKYYSHDPRRLDSGVQKWVSMAQALDGVADRPTDRPTDLRRQSRVAA